jgi:hypothetical protein
MSLTMQNKKCKEVSVFLRNLSQFLNTQKGYFVKQVQKNGAK